MNQQYIYLLIKDPNSTSNNLTHSRKPLRQTVPGPPERN